MQWRFNETNFAESSNFDPILERFYGHGVSGLIRENIQNSLDQILDETQPVKIRITLENHSVQIIPGWAELREHIQSLRSGNSYTEETINEMKSHIGEVQADFLTFEDSNTKGLSGSIFGQNTSGNYSYSAYAYSKGVHQKADQQEKEDVKGGSHGVGKIASNAASIFYTMFFANHDETDYKTLGGTIQLFDHLTNNKYYRSTGYFTDIENGDHLIPYQNIGYDKIFEKSSRGLKIVIPFVRNDFMDEKEIIRTVCDSFMIAIMKNKLEVEIQGKIINWENIEKYIYNDDYFSLDDELFIRHYYKSYSNDVNKSELSVMDLSRTYKFNLYFRYDQTIEKARTGIVRTVGMKIEDKLITSYGSKPYNALLIPASPQEDAFIKTLENESHTKIDSTHIKNEQNKKNAKRFINNLEKELKRIIDHEMQKHTNESGKMDTNDIIYTIENILSNESHQRVNEIVIQGKGENQQRIITTSTEEPGDEPGKKRKGQGPIAPRFPKVRRTFGNQSPSDYHILTGSVVRRYCSGFDEILEIDASASDEIRNIKRTNLVVTIVDGMGSEYIDEFNLKDHYVHIHDMNDQTSTISVDSFMMSGISLSNGIIRLQLESRDETSKNLKMRYYLEVC